MEKEIFNISITTEDIKYALEHKHIKPTQENIDCVVRHLNFGILYENTMQEIADIINNAIYDCISNKDKLCLRNI